jgi:hypothetical protein
MIAPNGSNRRRHTQRRCRRRWKIERLAWLQNFRRLTVRWEHRLDNFVGMLYLVCALILLKYL